MTDNGSNNHHGRLPPFLRALLPWSRLSIPIIAVAAIVLGFVPIPEAACEDVC